MSFRTGQMSYRRYQTVGQVPEEISADIVEALRKEIHTPGPVPKFLGMQYGWCGGRHVLDGEIEFGDHVFDNSLLFGLAEEMNDAPSSMVKALYAKAVKQAAKENPSGVASKRQRKEAKANAKAEADEEARKGRHCKVSVTPVLWDLDAKAIYTPAGGKRAERLFELFERSINVKFWCMTAGMIAEQEGVALGVQPQQFVDVTPGLFLSYGFLARSGAANHALDYLGCEFLLWLLWKQAAEGGVDVGISGLWVDPAAAMTLDDPYSVLGKTTLGDASTGRPGEPSTALAMGKMPVSATVHIHNANLKGPVTLHAKDLAVSGLDVHLPEDLDGDRQVVEYRLEVRRNVDETILKGFASFLELRKHEGDWADAVKGIRAWIKDGVVAEPAKQKHGGEGIESVTFTATSPGKPETSVTLTAERLRKLKQVTPEVAVGTLKVDPGAGAWDKVDAARKKIYPQLNKTEKAKAAKKGK